MINLNPFAVSSFLIAITSMPLFFLILIKGKTRLTRIYSLNILSVSIWGVGSFLSSIVTNPHIALSLWNFAILGVICIPVFFWHTVAILTKRIPGYQIILCYTQAIFFLAMIAMNKLTPSTKLMFGSIYYAQGKTIFLFFFLTWVSIIVFTHFVLLKYYFDTYPREKKQILYLIIAMSIGCIGGTMNFLPAFSINIYPYGNFLIPIYSIMMTYAILRHQIWNIELFVRKGVIYSILIAVITVSYLVLILLFERLLQGCIGYNSMATSIIIAFSLGILFVPIRNRTQSLVDRYFFKGTQSQIAEENERLRQEIARTEKLKAVSTLASGMAHEIKNPLTALKTFTEHLPKKKNDPEFLDKFSRIIGNEVNRIDGLVHQLLDFAKPSPLKLQKTDIHELINETLDLLNSKFIKNKIRVVKDYTDFKKITQIDSNRMKQALLNVFLNSIEAMNEGGTLTVQTKDFRQQATTDRLENRKQRTENRKDILQITITDTGCGITKTDLVHIFDPFFSKKDKGTGLGLSIVHQIVQEHGGKIRVESKVGSGTRFEISLPISV